MYVGGKQDIWLPGYWNMLIFGYSDVAPWQWMCSDTLNSAVWLPGELKIRLFPLWIPTDWLLGCSNVLSWISPLITVKRKDTGRATTVYYGSKLRNE